MKALLSIYDNCNEDIEVRKGDFVISNTNDFGLIRGKKYMIESVEALDLINVEVHKGHFGIYSVEWFDEVIK